MTIEQEMQAAIVIGAGPGGMACAAELAGRSPGARVMLLEAGHTLRKRKCPVDVGRRCSGCQGICNVVSGFGGSIHDGDGVKLSLLPSGRRLIDLFGEERARDLCDRAFAFFSGHMGEVPPLAGQDIAANVRDKFDRRGLVLREYPVAVLGERTVSHMLASIHGHLQKNVTLQLDTEVVGIERMLGGFRLRVKRRGSEATLYARNVVFATGRRGVRSTRGMLNELGVRTHAPEVSVGARFEMQAELLREMGLAHPDMKVSQRDTGAEKIKTFCFCGGVNGGRIKFTNYQDAFGGEIITLDGHETMERERPAGRDLAGNFGLLCQLDPRVPVDDAVLEREIFAPYRRLSNGRPVVQRLQDFLWRRVSSESWAEMRATMPFKPTVADLIAAPVHKLFTDSQHGSLVRGLMRVMGAVLDLAGVEKGLTSIARDILVIGLEAEFLWERVGVDENCEAEQRGIYVVGDSAGIAQGVIQAAMMGMSAGERISDQIEGRTRGASTLGMQWQQRSIESC